MHIGLGLSVLMIENCNTKTFKGISDNCGLPTLCQQFVEEPHMDLITVATYFWPNSLCKDSK